MTDTPSGGSIQHTAIASAAAGTALILLQYAVHPVWPPPESVLTIFAMSVIPPSHLIGRALWRLLTKWAGPEDAALPMPAAPPRAAAPAPAVPPIPPVMPVPPTPQVPA